MKNKINTNLIESYIKENNLSKTSFCKLCKISFSTLNKILSNNDDFYIIALFKIAKVINIKVHQMFNDEINSNNN